MESNKNVIYIGAGILAIVVVIFWLLPSNILSPILYTLLAIGSVFLVLLVLIQRGRGGGLAGALGGMGGYSAFGTRAGDVFTRITIIAASLWILGAMALARLNVEENRKMWNNPSVPAKKSIDSSGGIGLDESATGKDSTNDTGDSSAPDKTGDESRDR